ncbi:MAG: hypothetical protein FWG50_02530 [Kiritimatiellaeota bacterium]|nr:hypothetical protein [Kiritimatiellota bacterium]
MRFSENVFAVAVAGWVCAMTAQAGEWRKHEGNPVLGGKHGTCFDISVLREDAGYRMWVSWRPKASLALVESKDGLAWSDPPVVVLPPRKETGWEDDINRPVVLKKDGLYHLWYTGQAKGRSSIGHATSADGVQWTRHSDKPVLTAERPWEKVAVMCPHVNWDAEEELFKMWYSAGDQYEPDAIGYATSPDGVAWAKHPQNPVFRANPGKAWEKHKVTGAQVIKRKDGYLMFYIGFEDEHHAQIGMATSADGIAWTRHDKNPIVPTPPRGSPNDWDADACYKPYAIFDGQKWLLWYNGRKGSLEQIGVVLHEGDLSF